MVYESQFSLTPGAGHDMSRTDCEFEDIDNQYVVAVSNEVGMGIVPGKPLSRRYRDVEGFLNQRIASVAKKVLITFAGLPMVLKDE